MSGYLDLSGRIYDWSHFYWEEVTHAGKRPVDEAKANNARQLVVALRPYREAVNRPFNVTSWYRPPSVNLAVGGSTNSFHTIASAIDFWVPDMSGPLLADYFRDWNGGLGVYHNRIHVDIGPKRRW